MPSPLPARPEPPFVVRAYREGDEKEILDLFRASFHAERSVERWRWTYRENPYGGGPHVTGVYTPEGRLVAHYAGYPVRFAASVPGVPAHLDALQIGDTMTAADHRGVGRGPTSLLGRSVQHFYAHYCEGRVAFNYGFNTGNIQRFSMRFVRAERLEDCPYRVRQPLPRLPEPRGWGRLGWKVERIAHFDGRFDALFARVRGAYGLLVERSARYLEWRYAACPDTQYFIYTLSRFGRLVGWSVFRQKGEKLTWGDALFDPRHRRGLGILLNDVLARPEHRGTAFIEGWLSARPQWWYETLVELGFENRPEPQELGLVYVPFEVDPGEWFRKHLYYMWGDGDLF